MRTLIASKIYIPKLTHRDNNTKKWAKIVFIQDKSVKRLKLNTVVLTQVLGKLQQVRIIQICGKGWFKVETKGAL